MDFSLTIPGVFYDLIARVIPGFYLLIATRIFVPRAYEFFRAIDVGSKEGLAALGAILAAIVTCYLLGWILHGLALLTRLADRLRPKEGKEERDRQYDVLRLENESVGYRVLKLRAEATMLSTCLVATAVVFLADVALSWHEWSLAGRALAYLLLAASFHQAHAAAWERYCGVVKLDYQLVHVEKIGQEHE